MCQNCTNTEYFAELARVLAVALAVFQESYMAMREEDASMGALPPSLDRIIKICSTERKYKLCLVVTCGDTGEIAKLSDRASNCMTSKCDNCPSLRAVWTEFKEWLFDEVAEVEGRSAHAVFTIQRHWRHYAYRKKELSDKQKLWEASRGNADPDYKPKTESRELYLKGG